MLRLSTPSGWERVWYMLKPISEESLDTAEQFGASIFKDVLNVIEVNVFQRRIEVVALRDFRGKSKKIKTTLQCFSKTHSSCRITRFVLQKIFCQQRCLVFEQLHHISPSVTQHNSPVFPHLMAPPFTTSSCWERAPDSDSDPQPESNGH